MFFAGLDLSQVTVFFNVSAELDLDLTKSSLDSPTSSNVFAGRFLKLCLCLFACLCLSVLRFCPYSFVCWPVCGFHVTSSLHLGDLEVMSSKRRA